MDGIKGRAVGIGLLLALILALDQGLKFWVKTHMSIGMEFDFLGLDWFKIHFVENNGMAFGLQFGGAYGKLALSLFRLIAIGFLGYYIALLLRQRAGWGMLISFTLILAGAIGNVLDSAFYGLLFSASGFHQIAQFLPEGGGYAGLLHGKVVDMLHISVWHGYLPEWLPFWGGTYVELFKPVFNLADVSISTGVLSILLFQRSFFLAGEDEKTTTDPAEDAPPLAAEQVPVQERDSSPH